MPTKTKAPSKKISFEYDDIMGNEDTKDPFVDLGSSKYVNEEVLTKSAKDKLKLEKEQLKLDTAKRKEEERVKKLEAKAKPKEKVSTEDDDLFSKTPTELMGLDKRGLMRKVREYKSMFPDQLKNFKIKKSPTVEDLKSAISEMDAIVTTNSVEGFCTDAVLSLIGVVETVSTRTKYNILGTSEMLKQQPKFHDLCKQLYLKHHVFANVPPEFQLVMLVGMTAMMAKQNNDKRDSVNRFLGSSIQS